MNNFPESPAVHTSVLSKLIHSCIEEQAQLLPEQIALADDTHRLTYRELNEQANRLAAWLQQTYYIRPDDPVALCFDRGVEFVVAVLAVLKAGGAYVPVAPSYPEERIAYILQDAAVKAVLTQDVWHNKLAGIGQTAPNNTTPLPVVAIDRADFRKELTTWRAINPEPAVLPYHLAYIIYTSGTTGRPKGTQVTHQSVVHLVKEVDYVNITPADNLLALSTFSFDGAVFDIFGALLNGAAVFIADKESMLDPGKLEQLIIRHQISLFFVTTALFNTLVDEQLPGLSRLRQILFGGEQASPVHVADFLKNYPEVQLTNVYGPTECTTFATTFLCNQRLAENATVVPIGTAITGATTYVLDEQLQQQPAGVVGELYLGGTGVARGYVNLPELTARHFIRNPFRTAAQVAAGTHEKLYRTGDLAQYLPDGNLVCLGRIDGQVKIRGYRIEPDEIAVELNTLPGVKQAVVVVQDDADARNKFLVGYYVADQELDHVALLEQLQGRLPEYMIPAGLVYLPALPLTANGKTDKNALPKYQLAVEDTGHEPGSEAAAKLAEIWKAVLKLPYIDTRKGFIELGGNSIIAITLRSKMNKAGFPMTLRDIFHYKSIEEIVKHLFTTQENKQLQTPEELLAYLEERTGTRFYYREVTITKDGRKGKIRVLYTRQLVNLAAHEITALLRTQVVTAILPEYFSLDGRLSELPEDAVLDENALGAWLGLQPLDNLDISYYETQFTQNLARLDEWVKTKPVIDKHALSTMQQLQIGFKTPASAAVMLIEGYVDIPLLEKAYSILIEKQGLLRSIAVKQEEGYVWEEHSYDATAFTPAVLVLDLRGYQATPEALEERVGALLAYKYEPDTLLHQLVLFRTNQRENHLLMVFSHVIFDRVSGEVIKGQLMNYYNALLHQQPLPEEEMVSFGAYTEQINKGPQQLTEANVLAAFELETYYESKQKMKQAVKGLGSEWSYEFNISVPVEGKLEEVNGWELGTTLFARAMARYLGITAVPVLFVCEGRQYEENGFYNTVGEFTDMVPMVVHADHQSSEIRTSVSGRLAQLKKHNLNFLNILMHPSFRNTWSKTIRLMDVGENFEFMDMLMFNFLGNREDEDMLAIEESVKVTPNPLPMYSLLNCITATAPGRLIFLFRTSYTVDIERLRKIFRQVVQEW
ncbi:non-ribosomal peptide synthetase [Chitinophaga nivalis]|uniref:Amino acid adenylation domain-containing protein n=1 Tax=Chitinophaga nivalis TaxID=2991709 RepID=A0ABT3IMN5_9BACT|nr:non-ribosomal peptide synthetase [Chitinophaga nivalis]MCW3465319.1 amino acid adenylation domain-containing protein [Chitinophaga nivalis]MCW3484989.1 amino acid adenylation domain-containing protein [Chitinophaga nivalis]